MREPGEECSEHEAGRTGLPADQSASGEADEKVGQPSGSRVGA